MCSQALFSETGLPDPALLPVQLPLTFWTRPLQSGHSRATTPPPPCCQQDVKGPVQ